MGLGVEVRARFDQIVNPSRIMVKLALQCFHVGCRIWRKLSEVNGHGHN